jgi:hypothetical protein
MVRHADPAALREHLERLDPRRLPRDGFSAMDARRLDRLAARAYESLDAQDVAHALELVARNGYSAPWFAYFLPAALRTPPDRDLRATDRLLAGLFATRGDAALDAWATDVEAVLLDLLARRPLRGGDDPVDLWLSERSSRWLELDARRRLVHVAKVRLGPGTGWRESPEGPPYARIALAVLASRPEAACERFLAWESSDHLNPRRAAIEVAFHAHGEGWRPEPAPLADLFSSPDRTKAALSLLPHPAHDVALAGAALVCLRDPRRAASIRPMVAERLRRLDASSDDRFVLVPSVRRLLVGE